MQMDRTRFVVMGTDGGDLYQVDPEEDPKPVSASVLYNKCSNNASEWGVGSH